MNLKNKIKYSKGYIIIKDTDENDLIDAKEYFEQPEKYLTLNPKIAIGVSPYKTKFYQQNKLELNTIEKDNQKKLKLSRNSSKKRNSINIINDNITKTEEPKKLRSLFSLKEKPIPAKLKLDNIFDNQKLKMQDINQNKNNNILKQKRFYTLESKKIKDNIHYQFRTFKELKKLFKDSIEREKYFKSQGTNDLMPIRTDSNIKKKYFSQEKRLKFNETAKINEEKFLKFIAKKCKKDENELLINNIEDFRLKKQIQEYVENNKILSEKFGDNYWLFSLRRSDKNDFLRLNYINVGNNKREIWKRFLDYPDKDIELINDPYNKTKNKITNMTNFSNRYKNEINKIPNLKGINDIKIEGKNLAQKEFKDIVDITQLSQNNCKFKLYKDPRENNKNYVSNFTCREFYKFNNIKIRNLNKNDNNKYQKTLDKNKNKIKIKINNRHSLSTKIIKKNKI